MTTKQFTNLINTIKEYNLTEINATGERGNYWYYNQEETLNEINDTIFNHGGLENFKLTRTQDKYYGTIVYTIKNIETNETWLKIKLDNLCKIQK